MTKDLNKGIFDITYNHLNLPVEIDFSQRKPLIKEITYRYDATGMKLEKSVKDGTTITTQYAGGFIYNNNGGDQKLQFFSHREGYVEPVAGTSGSATGFNDEIGINSSSYKYVF